MTDNEYFSQARFRVSDWWDLDLKSTLDQSGRDVPKFPVNTVDCQSPYVVFCQESLIVARDGSARLTPLQLLKALGEEGGGSFESHYRTRQPFRIVGWRARRLSRTEPHGGFPHFCQTQI